METGQFGLRELELEDLKLLETALSHLRHARSALEYCGQIEEREKETHEDRVARHLHWKIRQAIEKGWG